MASSAAAAELIVYTTPTCPDCHALKAWLNDIRFIERDLTDPHIAEEAKTLTGVRVAPITIAGDAVFYGSFATQKAQLDLLVGRRGA